MSGLLAVQICMLQHDCRSMQLVQHTCASLELSDMSLPPVAGTDV